MSSRGVHVHEQPHILLVEDNPGDVRLIRESLEESSLAVRLSVAKDGDEALALLRGGGGGGGGGAEGGRPPLRPQLVILDLNLPRKDGRELLQEIKSDVALRMIPVIVLTSSASPEDVRRCYDSHASCYIRKPVGFDELDRMLKTVAEFWLGVVTLPPS